MPDHSAILQAVAFVESYGYALLFFWVLAEQSALPIPAAPLLIAAGALIRDGRMQGIPAVGCCVAAALIADTSWFLLGRRGGRRVLGLVCRVSLEPDSCVRQTENAFLKHGLKALLLSKFVPGLNAVAAPLAGHSKASYARFLLYDGAGASIWATSFLAIGYLFSEQIEAAFSYASRMGSGLLLLVMALLAWWIGRKYLQRRRVLKDLRVARIAPEELRDRLNAGEDLMIIDLRNRMVVSVELIPGALRISPDELAGRIEEIPRDREIVLFCS